MEYVTVAEHKVPVAYDVDILVAGGGCAGVGAAIAGARLGAKTLVVERMFYLGGMMTGGLMSKIALNFRDHGLAREIVRRLDAYQHTHFLEGEPEIPMDPEAAKLVLDRMVVDEAGAEVLFGTSVTGVVMEGRKIKYALINGLNGEEAVRAKYFIDCTGDGQLAYTAGAEHMLGDADGYSSSPTLMFRVGNVDIELLTTFMECVPILRAHEYTNYKHQVIAPFQNREKIECDYYANFTDFIPYIKSKIEEYPDLFSEWEKEVLLARGILCINQPDPTQVLVNCTRIKHFKGDSSKEVSEAMLEGRKQCECIFRFMKRFIPGFGKSFLMDTGSLLGIRESRRIKGDYVFTKEDIYSSRKFEDGIVANSGGIEIHKPDGTGSDIREVKKGEYYTVPYRSIIAKDFDNLYMAGRCFSASHEGLSGARQISYCTAIGAAAATAASMLVKAGLENVRDVDIKELRERLADQI